MDADRLSDRLALQELKARYFRFMDTKQWGNWRGLFTDDMVFYNNDGPLPTSTDPMSASGDDFVEMVSQQLVNCVTVHQGHMSELTFTGDNEARGVWAMFDWVDSSGYGGGSMQGFGHYYEHYVKGDDGNWRIKELNLTRLRTDQTDPTGMELKIANPPWKRTVNAS
jgi:hypothetical protein